MTTITTEKKLADALRACELQLREYVDYHQKRGGCSLEMEDAWTDAREALAEHDAQQAATPAPGAHTAEPWSVVTHGEAAYVSLFIGTHGLPASATGFAEFAVQPYCRRPEAAANAARIVACVNACAGIPTAALLALETIRITGEHANGDCFTFERGQPGPLPVHDPRGAIPIPPLVGGAA